MQGKRGGDPPREIVHADFLILLFALLATSFVAAAQERGELARELDGVGPVDLLLERRADVGLSAAQVERLQAVREELAERNRPLLAELLRIRQEVRGKDASIGNATPEERALFRSRVAEARPLLQRVRQNNRWAMQRVGGILTPQQRVRVRDRLRDGWQQGGTVRPRPPLRDRNRRRPRGRGRGG